MTFSCLEVWCDFADSVVVTSPFAWEVIYTLEPVIVGLLLCHTPLISLVKNVTCLQKWLLKITSSQIFVTTLPEIFYNAKGNKGFHWLIKIQEFFCYCRGDGARGSDVATRGFGKRLSKLIQCTAVMGATTEECSSGGGGGTDTRLGLPRK